MIAATDGKKERKHKKAPMVDLSGKLHTTVYIKSNKKAMNTESKYQQEEIKPVSHSKTVRPSDSKKKDKKSKKEKKIKGGVAVLKPPPNQKDFDQSILNVTDFKDYTHILSEAPISENSKEEDSDDEVIMPKASVP